MYDIKATVTRDALVTPGSVFLFALGENPSEDFHSARKGSEWRGFIFGALSEAAFPPANPGRVEAGRGLAVRHKLVPPATPGRSNWSSHRSPTRRVFDSAGQAAPKAAGVGGAYSIASWTVPRRADHRGTYRALERSCGGGPQGGQGHLGTDAAAGRWRAVATWAEIRLAASDAPRARARWVIEKTDHPGRASLARRGVEFLAENERRDPRPAGHWGAAARGLRSWRARPAAPRCPRAEGAAEDSASSVRDTSAGTLASLWVKAGHEVLVSSRQPRAAPGGWCARSGPRARAGTPREAALFGNCPRPGSRWP